MDDLDIDLDILLDEKCETFMEWLDSQDHVIVETELVDA